MGSEGETRERSEADDRRRILVVDDDESIREGIAQALRSGPKAYQVETARDAGSAQQTFAAFRPDLVILDVLMPDRDGLDVCRQIREITGRHSVKIIILTAYPDFGYREDALLCDADLFLPKPQPIEALEEFIEELLEV